MIRLVIHGGAGALPRSEMTPGRAKEFHEALQRALRVGLAVLEKRGSSLDAVQATVVDLEDCPLFNAGRGSSFTRDGTIEMEASIMEGKSRMAGATMLLRHVKNPVSLARLIMEKTPHVSLGGEAAERFAADHGLALEAAEYFFTPFRYNAMLKLRGTDRTALSEDMVVPAAKLNDQDAFGTVGAVALDADGHLAAATSSGGTTNKHSGRLGQACAIGAGCYADDRTCAVSCTGQGEGFIRASAAFDVAALMAYRGLDLPQAADLVLNRHVTEAGGRGGLIALDRNGAFSLPFNTQGMYRGWTDPSGVLHTGIYDTLETSP